MGLSEDQITSQKIDACLLPTWACKQTDVSIPDVDSYEPTTLQVARAAGPLTPSPRPL